MWNALKIQDFPVLGFAGRVTTPPCGGENGSRRKKCNSDKNCKSEGSKESGWVYTDQEPGAKMEIPAEVQRREIP